MKIRVAVLVLLVVSGSAHLALAGHIEDSLRTVLDSVHPLAAAEKSGFVVREGRIQIVAIAAGASTAGIEGWLESRGASHILAVRGRVQAFVPPRVITDLGSRPDVVSVERPHYAVLPEPSPPAAPAKLSITAETSEALEIMNVAAWHASGFAGDGIRIGVIDLEFSGWESLLGVELPPAGRTTYRAFGGSTSQPSQVHGTACAEIVHDIAPDADLYLALISSDNDFFAALDWMAMEGVDVVTMSVGWFGTGPGDGTGVFADEITAFIAASDALFLTSAGNERLAHWQGSTIDENGDGWLEFSTGDDLNELAGSFSNGDRVSLFVTWDDWAGPTSDYSLHLYNLSGTEPVEVAQSNRPQTGQSWQTPYERISYTAPSGGRFGFRINRSGVTGVNDLEVFSPASDLNHRVAEGSLTIPSDSADVMTVAAINYQAPYMVREFSSAGPSNGPGGSFSGGLIKPDISGYDGVSTVSYGPRGFFGTSAASPHAAGAAALARQAEPGFDSVETREFLEQRAHDLGPSGKDNDYGWGRVVMGPIPGSTCTYSISPTETSVGASGGGGIIHVTTDDGCPWTTSSAQEWLSFAPPTGEGTGIVGFTVDANPGPARVGDIRVAGFSFVVNQAGVDPVVSTMVAGVAETEGLEQTRWRSDLALMNPGLTDAETELVYRHASGEAESSVIIGPGEVVELVNIAVETFGVADSAGAVEVQSNGDLIVTARTYNDTPDGTFGQFIPGVGPLSGLVTGDVAALAQLAGNEEMRTNIGFVDLGGTGAVARVRLFDGSGDVVGEELNENIPAGGWFQRNRVFRAAGADDCTGCYALIDLVGQGGPVWAYASVVDNESGDPTTIPMDIVVAAKIAAAGRSLVAGIAETDGANQTTWKSNLALLNLAGEGVTADLVYRHAGADETSSVTLAEGELREFANIAADLFGAPGSAGAVDVDATGELVVTARTFNDSPDGTFGQFLPGLGEDAALIPGKRGILSQIKSTEAFRTNIGFTNYSAMPCDIRVSLYDDGGVRKGQLFAAVPAGGWEQVNRVFNAAGVGECPLGYAVVEVLTADCSVWTYASVVDNHSGDPTTIPVAVR